MQKIAPDRSPCPLVIGRAQGLVRSTSTALRFQCVAENRKYGNYDSADNYPDKDLCQHCTHGSSTLVLCSRARLRSEEHTSELQSRFDLVCRLLLEKKKKK